MVDGPIVCPPSPDCGARGREPPRPQRDPLAWGGHIGAMIVGHADAPALGGRRALDRQVAAERDKHATAHASARRGGATVGTERLGSGAQVHDHAPRSGHGSGSAIDLDRAPSGNRRDRPCRALAAGDRVEIAVVAERDQRLSNGRVDVPVGHPGRPQRGLDRVQQQRAHPHRGSRRRIQRGELGIFSKARARLVEPRDDPLDGRTGLLERGGIGHRHDGGASERAEADGRLEFRHLVSCAELKSRPRRPRRHRRSSSRGREQARAAAPTAAEPSWRRPSSPSPSSRNPSSRSPSSRSRTIPSSANRGPGRGPAGRARRLPRGAEAPGRWRTRHGSTSWPAWPRRSAAWRRATCPARAPTPALPAPLSGPLRRRASTAALLIAARARRHARVPPTPCLAGVSGLPASP